MLKVSDYPTMRNYKHHSGRIYTLLIISNTNLARGGWTEQCTFVSVEDKQVFTRPLMEFAAKFTLLEDPVPAALPLKVEDGFNMPLRSPYGNMEEKLATILMPIVLLDVFGSSMNITTK